MNTVSKRTFTHDEAVVASILTVEETVAGLEQEEAGLCVVVV